MSYYEDREFDPYGDGEDEDDEPRETSCKRCGKGGLQWEDDNGRWALINAKGEIHKCDEKAVHKTALTGFEDLTK